ncbi:MAG: hypothetical protein KQH63_10625 [Desulfobulbaceae bacterium]|nr:hypothetical protein [Desulfobulbaceae bacterium]
MKHVLLSVTALTLLTGTALADDHDRESSYRYSSESSSYSRGIEMSVNPSPALVGSEVRFVCTATGNWEDSLERARITISNAADDKIVEKRRMDIHDRTATYDFTIPTDEMTGEWDFRCSLTDDEEHRERKTSQFTVTASVTGGGSGGGTDDPDSGTGAPPTTGNPLNAHQSIQSYDGPSTCIACHELEAQDMLESLHMQWSGPTPDVTNISGDDGKAVNGINTFCSYAMSSKGACFSCHVRADGNAPHAPELNDVDCMMCHNDTYQRTFVSDPNNIETVVNIDGETKTYVFGKVDAEGNYTTVPDFSKMPAGTTMVELARNVHLPTRKSCLRCHAKAGGGDWTKRGDMGLNTVAPTLVEDVHMSAEAGGADLTCSACHAAENHKVGGRGIDLRQTEAANPQCTDCHSAGPHSNSTLNRHAAGQVSCQVCHIREFGKGGATEMSRDWLKPVWNAGFCSGQGGFVGEEIKVANVKPEYVWFDGTSEVYSIGQTIQADERGVYPMANANGGAFDGNSKIVPIKRHYSIMPLHESGQIVAPAIMWMFMTGDFDQAVQKGMEEQGMTGSYQLVDVDAEMLISHGVEPASMAPSCTECHDYSGETPDGSGMVPFTELGYHTWPEEVKNCTLCHERKSLSWQSLHNEHASGEGALSCVSCHTSEPAGLVKPQSDLCNDCHGSKSWGGSELHKKHLEKGYECVRCHTFE